MRIIFYNIIHFYRIRLQVKNTSLPKGRHSLIGKFETNFKMPKSFISKVYPNPTQWHFRIIFPIISDLVLETLFLWDCATVCEAGCYKIYIYSFFQYILWLGFNFTSWVTAVIGCLCIDFSDNDKKCRRDSDGRLYKAKWILSSLTTVIFCFYRLGTW